MFLTPDRKHSLGDFIRRERQHSTTRSVQFMLFALAGAGAFLARFDFKIPPDQREHLWSALLIWLIIKPVVFECFGLTRRTWRFVSIGDAARLLSANTVSAALGAIAILMFCGRGFPRSIYFIDFTLCLMLTAGAPIAARVIAEMARPRKTPGAEPVFIYGAGAAGVALLRELRSNASPYEVCGFVDDDPLKLGSTIHSLRVLGCGADLRELAPKHHVRLVLIAIPAASGPATVRILRNCQDARLKCRTVPKLAEIISGRALASQVREVAVEDVLGRIPVILDEEGILARFNGQSVMITGAAGSIGSEICRQIARYRPGQIIGFDISETGLFYLEHEMRERFPDLPFVPEIGNIQNSQRLAEVFTKYSPTVMYHAAAYKHVPLMEEQLFEAVENNIFGTYNVAIAAAKYGVRDFVMISSDKAVRPTSIMGTTKRVAELIVNSLQGGEGKFVSVRFGNVLGSNGSVVPLFKTQIAAGGPVKVTHPEMRRYFMTIPEAAQLVLQASLMGNGGEIFVLDMGQPVRIVDLARNLILLSGFTPDEDIKIEFTGIRPGEKLYEELSLLEEDTRPTFHEKIRVFAGNGFPVDSARTYVNCLRDFCAARDSQSLLLQLKDLVPDYNPSAHILRRVIGPDMAGRATKPAAVAASAAGD
jgi:FlaA1/EpsC-like NDP-sugar epimerase